MPHIQAGIAGKGPAGSDASSRGSVAGTKEKTEEMESLETAASGREERRTRLARLAAGVFLCLAALLMKPGISVELLLYLLSYLLIGGEVILKALENIRRGRVFDENFLMTTATVGAFAIGEFSEAVAVMLFYQVGESFQEAAVDRSRRSIRELLKIRPDYANLKQGDAVLTVSPNEVRAGEVILVKPGERVPLDGVVLDGSSFVDTSALTGEAVPRGVKPGDEVLAGFVNTTGLISLEVTREYGQSTAARILELVQNAAGQKAPAEKFFTRFSRYYTPAVVGCAAALALVPPLAAGGGYSDWLYRALVFLVVSCPCALVISIPLSFFGGIGGASRNGILVKGGNFLEALSSVDTVVFDKTGTLTKGVFRVASVRPKDGLSREEFLEEAALAEYYSNHPIARSIEEYYGGTVDKERIESFEEVAGGGVKATAGGKTILAGNRRLMENAGIEIRSEEEDGTTVYLAVDGKLWGSVLIVDELKEDSRDAVQGLKSLGVKRVCLLSGDRRDAAAQVARELGLDEACGELLPHEKVERMERLCQTKGKGSLVFVGDGLNDAPVLARADVGVAMGGLGADAAIEAADVVLMTGEPSRLVTAMRIARKTKKIVWQNIFLALGVKGAVLLLSACGFATMWGAVFADTGVALAAVLNALRSLKTA
ncbi:MAG: heavy metal translocating P-type ATPase [Peptococcaceae bacterium]|nr:heavy metal translocating P-type ATPase [Peptococcaceae bacterium]MDH7525043.1 heavy metal translocating P-type ATPase [Peptococcaceae bacterium]